jgi:sugar phosphate isomerase/epimerase
VDGYLQCMAHAAERGVVVLLETHDDWSNTASVRAVVERADHPNLKVLWDCMHPQRMLETVEESFNAVGKVRKTPRWPRSWASFSLL